MKTLIGIIAVLLVIFGIYQLSKNGEAPGIVNNQATSTIPVTITPVSHATAILEWDGTTIITDPVGTSTLLQANPAEIIVVTDIHGDHLSTSTLNTVVGSSTLIVPQAVRDLLPTQLATRAHVLANGSSTSVLGFTIEAVPMYNLPAATSSRHIKGRGNGYIIEKGGFRVYIAGDTSGTPEMRALNDIDIAFVPMNLPFTMSVEEAADAVLAFKPRQVYPYHYRGQDGLSDVSRFKELVNDGDPNIDVVLLNWYPTQ